MRRKAASPGNSIFQPRRVLRVIAFYPALIAAIVVILGLATQGFPTRPKRPFSPGGPCEVSAWISRPPQIMDDHIYLEVEPISVVQKARCLSFEGRIGLYISSSTLSPPEFFQPELSYGERISFTSYLREPSYYAVPGVLDPRDLAWLRGRPYRVYLKSPHQLQRHGLQVAVDATLLRPLFLYLNSFLSACKERLTQQGYKLVVCSFLGNKALLDQSELKTLREIGAIHLIVVSGFHIGLVIAVLHWIFSNAGFKYRILVIAATWCYIGIIGFPVSAVRAGTIATVAYPMITIGVRTRLLNLLGFSAIVIISIAPNSIFLPSFQLSFSCLLAICLLVVPASRFVNAACEGLTDVRSDRVLVSQEPDVILRRRVRFFVEDRLPFSKLERVKQFLRLTLPVLRRIAILIICTLAIQLTILPLLLYYSNRWSPMNTASNLFLIPLFSIFVPLCFVFFLTHWLPISFVTCWLLERLSTIIQGLIDQLGAFTSLFFTSQPTGFQLWFYYGILFLVLVLPLRKWTPLALLLPPLVLSFFVFGRFNTDQKLLQITMLDVGQGDSIHIRYPSGASSLIDTGGNSYPSGADRIGEQVTSRYLWEEDCLGLNAILITHPETDHNGGYNFISKAFNIKHLLYYEDSSLYLGNRRQITAGNSFVKGGVWHEVLHPEKAAPASLGRNDRSVVFKLQFGRFSMLFTGDITTDVERLLLSALDSVVVLKVGHHGSKSSTSKGLLEKLSPRIALISAGRNNVFGHPSPEVVTRLRESGCLPFCTTDWGTLRILTDGQTLSLLHYSIKKKRFIEILNYKLGQPKCDPARCSVGL